MTKPGGVVRATSESASEVMGKLNLTHYAMERVTEELVMMMEPWVPASDGHPETPPGLWG